MEELDTIIDKQKAQAVNRQRKFRTKLKTDKERYENFKVKDALRKKQERDSIGKLNSKEAKEKEKLRKRAYRLKKKIEKEQKTMKTPEDYRKDTRRKVIEKLQFFNISLMYII